MILGGGAFLLRAPILTAAANAWIVHEPEFEWVDAVVVPGGGIDTRPFTAAKLFHEGKTDRIVTFKTEPLPATILGVTPEHHELNLQVLRSLEVPDASISVIGDGVTSTWDEVNVCREWSEDNEIQSLAIMTEIFPSRRVQWAYEHGFGLANTELHVWAIAPRNYDTNSWWMDEGGVIAFQNEAIKKIYYLLKY